MDIFFDLLFDSLDFQGNIYIYTCFFRNSWNLKNGEN